MADARTRIAEILAATQPPIMEAATQSANWPTETTGAPAPGPRKFSRAAGFLNDADRQAQLQDAVKFWMGLGSSVADLGGLTSQIASATGHDHVASAIKEGRSQDGFSSFIGDFSPTSIPGGLWNAGKDFVSGIHDTFAKDDMPEPKALGREEFFSAHRKSRESLEEAQARAEREFMASPGYQEMIKGKMVTKANEALRTAGERAKQTWVEGQKNVAADEVKIQADYDAHLDDTNKQLEAYYSRGFGERNPWFKSLLAAATPIAGYKSSKWLGKLADEGAGLLNASKTAAASGNPLEAVQANKSLESFQNSLGRRQAYRVGAAAAIPLEIRGFSDVMDAYGQPKTYQDAHGHAVEVPSQQRAAEHLQPLNFIADSVPALMSGAVGAGVGAFGAKSVPMNEIKGRTANVTPDDLKAFAGLQIENLQHAGKIAQARQASAGELTAAADAEGTLARSQLDALEKQQLLSEAQRRTGGQMGAPGPVQQPAAFQPSPSHGPAAPRQTAAVANPVSITLPQPLVDAINGNTTAINDLLTNLNTSKVPVNVGGGGAVQKTSLDDIWASKHSDNARNIIADHLAGGGNIIPKMPAKKGGMPIESLDKQIASAAGGKGVGKHQTGQRLDVLREELSGQGLDITKLTNPQFLEALKRIDPRTFSIPLMMGAGAAGLSGNPRDDMARILAGGS